jgi:hypothetical protein
MIRMPIGSGASRPHRTARNRRNGARNELESLPAIPRITQSTDNVAAGGNIRQQLRGGLLYKIIALGGLPSQVAARKHIRSRRLFRKLFWELNCST